MKNNVTNKKTAIGYIALTSGKKPTPENIKDDAEYFTQHNLCKASAKAFKLALETPITFDHTNYPQADWLGRPSFIKVITKAQEAEAALLIYDIPRLFRRYATDELDKVVKNLMAYEVPIIDTAYNRPMQSHRELFLHVAAYRNRATIKKAIARQNNHTSGGTNPNTPTKGARRRADIFRKKNAKTFADEIYTTIVAIKSRLVRESIKPTLQRIADELNSQGITARRGGKWTSTSVKRIQDRLKEH